MVLVPCDFTWGQKSDFNINFLFGEWRGDLWQHAVPGKLLPFQRVFHRFWPCEKWPVHRFWHFIPGEKHCKSSQVFHRVFHRFCHRVKTHSVFHRVLHGFWPCEKCPFHRFWHFLPCEKHCESSQVFNRFFTGSFTGFFTG